MTHSARVDWCVFAAIGLALAATFWGTSYWITAPVLLILVLCAYPQSYETTAAGLRVRDALTQRLIPYHAITMVAPTKAAMLSPSRVKVQFGWAGELLLAPADDDQFIADLAERSPHLIRRGSQLVLRDRHVIYHVSRGPAQGFSLR